ncbi:heterokaryon incompatibility protein-domain-containing protein [Rhexocercosporidium sp. MPI-PUGE-AT-0058]|nr:heterokaryon incompatibility protein-domain-containing protein [Rhexocercosporidium sp. MPI-PUGE-AT-0058]
MRLLQYNNEGEFSLTKDLFGDAIPDYAILSHTWEADTEEVTYRDMTDGTGKNKIGYKKIRFCGAQARRDGWEYFWVDTCCIDKTNSVELQEAINSMFRWYQEAKVCYVYLSDVHLEVNDNLGKLVIQESKWFKRGWTLQELLAPHEVKFYDSNWRLIGDKESFCPIISSITGIGVNCILDSLEVRREMYFTRISWVEDRETSKAEDIAYCLMGILDVYMPLQYGEGESKAFERLQHALVKRTSSSSLLAWGLSFDQCISTGPDLWSIFPRSIKRQNILAQSPKRFSHQLVLESVATLRDRNKAWVHTNRGLKVELMLVEKADWCIIADEKGTPQRHDLAIAILPFTRPGNSFECPGVLLSGNSLDRTYNRISCPKGHPSVMVPARLVSQAKPSKVYLTDLPSYREVLPPAIRDKLVMVDAIGFQVDTVELHRCDWRSTDNSLMLHPDVPHDTQQSVLRFLDTADMRSYFDLRISNSFIASESSEGNIEKSDRWRFRRLRLEVCNEYEGSLVRSSISESRDHAIEPSGATISLGAKMVKISLEVNESLVWLLYTVTISTTRGADF